MNTQAGKSVGFALLLAAGLLAALFAMGVFSANGVGAHDAADPHDDEAIHLTAGAITVTGGGELTIADNTYEYSIAVERGATEVSFDLAAATPEGSIVVSDDLNDNDANTDEFQVAIDLSDGKVYEVTFTVQDDPTSNTDVGDTASLYTIKLTYENPASADNSALADGAAVLTLGAQMADEAATADDMLVITFPEGYVVPTGPIEAITVYQAASLTDVNDATTPATVTATGNDNTVEIAGLAAAFGANDFVRIEISSRAGIINPEEAGTYNVTVTHRDADGTAGTPPTVSNTVIGANYVTIEDIDAATPTTEAGAGVALDLVAFVGADSRDDITIDLAKFGLPSSVDEDDITIIQSAGRLATQADVTAGDAAAVGELIEVATRSGSPSVVTVSGSKLIMRFAGVKASGATAASWALHANVISYIEIPKRVGITNPIRADEYTITISSEDGDEYVGNSVTVDRTVKVDPTSGTRGTEITITGKGFTDGDADLFFNNEDSDEFKRSPSVNIADGSFEVTVDTSDKDNNGDSIFVGTTTVKVSDAQGDGATNEDTDDQASFEIEPSFTLDPESPKPGEDVEITLVDTDGPATSISFAGSNAITITAEHVDDEDDKVATVQVPGGVRTGTIQISVMATDLDDPLTMNVTIGTNDLTVTPTTVVPRQTISIDGSGFSPRGNVDHADVIIDGKPVNDTRDDEVELVNNSGNISFDVVVPGGVTAGENRTVVVTDDGLRVGTATITVAEAELTLEPAESLRGSTITVSGTGFPANDLVLIKYDESTVDTATTSPTGTFEQDITVPAGEDIIPGSTYPVGAESQVNAVTVTASEDHKILDPEITLSSDSATPGSAISITGANFKGFLRVSLIEIGGQDVTPVPAPSTDQWGAFTASDIQVPQLNLTRHAVKVVVGNPDGSDGDATEFLTLVATPVSNAPADVFASLGDNLQVVWHYDNATSTWASYDPEVPEGLDLVYLEEISSGDIVWIEVTEDQEFQGGQLYAGWNLITIQ